MQLRLFWGMGYVGLALNISFLMYFGIFAAVPLLYLFHSFRPTLPWSCEAFLEWIEHEKDSEKYAHNICNLTLLNAPTNTTTTTTTTTISTLNVELTNGTSNDTMEENRYKPYQIPSVIFFRSLFHNYDFLDPEGNELVWSWQLVFFMLLVWGLIALFFYKVTDMEKISVCIRYSVWTIGGIMFLCIVRFSFTESGIDALHRYFIPRWHSIAFGIEATPIFVATSFGSCWGSIITLSSHNKFETNILGYSWIICIGQGVIIFLFGLASFLIDWHFETIVTGEYYYYEQQQWSMYLSSGTFMAHMGWPNMWCILFYTMLTLATLLVMVIQIFAVLSAVFDDFEFFRERKEEVTFKFIGFLMLSSIYFCTNVGLTCFTALSMDALFTQTALNLLLILVVLWIYGRERFQRDIEFMLGQPFATWRVSMLRFVAPLMMVFTLLLSFVVAITEHIYASLAVGIFAIFLIVLPWLFIPGYAAFRMCQQASGSVWERFKRCSHPTDWYPVEAENRQRYEELVGNTDITHQLSELPEDVA